MKRSRILTALITLAVTALLCGLMAAPAQARVDGSDLPSTGTVAKYFPGYKYSQRKLLRGDAVYVPGTTCNAEKLHRTTSLIAADYLPTYRSDWGSSPLKPAISILAAETSTVASAKKLVGSFRAHAQRCRSFTATGGVKATTASLYLGSVGEERVGIRQTERHPEGLIFGTFSVIRKGRQVTMVFTSSATKLSSTRVVGLSRAAYRQVS